MTSASDILQNSRAALEIAPLHAKWGWIVTLGAVYVIVGFIALGSVVVATVASVLVVGVAMIVAGIAEVINAFQVKNWGKFLLWALLGVLYVIAGFVTFENPLLAAALLTLVLGASLVASGIMRIILAFSMKRETPWIWVAIRHHHAAARLADPRALADQQRLYPRFVARNRSYHRGRGLDRDWLGLTPRSGIATVAIAGLIALLRWLPSRDRQLIAAAVGRAPARAAYYG